LFHNWLTDGGEVVSLTRLSPFTHRKIKDDSNIPWHILNNKLSFGSTERNMITDRSKKESYLEC
jgi:hypothetical protein